MNRFTSSPAYLNGLPPTGQTTVYVTGDDGTYQTGIPHRYEVLTTGQHSGTTAIILNGKTDTHSNECVIDHQYRLMWSRVFSVGVGPTSNGLLPFTANAGGEGYFTYAAAANTASLAGYTDWRVPNFFEVQTQIILAAPAADTDPTAFPAISSTIATSTTVPNGTTTNITIATTTSGLPSVATKTTASARVWLVRSI